MEYSSTLIPKLFFVSHRKNVGLFSYGDLKGTGRHPIAIIVSSKSWSSLCTPENELSVNKKFHFRVASCFLTGG